MRGSKTSSRLLVAVAIYLAVLTSCAPKEGEFQNTSVPSSQDPTMSATKEAVSLEPVELPEYLKRVWPLPGSTMSAQAYDESFDRFSLLSGNIGVGVELLAYKIAEEGDIDIDWIGRSSLLVDGMLVADNVGEFADGAVLYTEYTVDADGQEHLVYRVGGPYLMAWRVPLESGEHKAVFQVRQSSGVILEYSWQFTIVP